MARSSGGGHRVVGERGVGGVAGQGLLEGLSSGDARLGALAGLRAWPWGLELLEGVGTGDDWRSAGATLLPWGTGLELLEGLGKVDGVLDVQATLPPLLGLSFFPDLAARSMARRLALMVSRCYERGQRLYLCYIEWAEPRE
jgi:hypothetical protein